MPELFQNHPLITDANLQGYWKFEENLTDSSGNGHTLTPNGTPTYQNDGKYDYVNFLQRYTQVTQGYYALISDGMNVDGGDITMCVWFRDFTTRTGTDSGIIGQANITSHTRYAISRDSAGTGLIFYRGGIGGGGTEGKITLTWATYISTTTWAHLSLTYDGTNVKAYVNGNYINQAAASGDGSGCGGSATGFGVGITSGWDGWTGPKYCAMGHYDEAVVFNRALTAEEISSIYNFQLLNNRRYRRIRLPGSIV